MNLANEMICLLCLEQNGEIIEETEELEINPDAKAITLSNGDALCVRHALGYHGYDSNTGKWKK